MKKGTEIYAVRKKVRNFKRLNSFILSLIIISSSVLFALSIKNISTSTIPMIENGTIIELDNDFDFDFNNFDTFFDNLNDTETSYNIEVSGSIFIDNSGYIPIKIKNASLSSNLIFLIEFNEILNMDSLELPIPVGIQIEPITAPIKTITELTFIGFIDFDSMRFAFLEELNTLMENLETIMENIEIETGTEFEEDFEPITANIILQEIELNLIINFIISEIQITATIKDVEGFNIEN